MKHTAVYYLQKRVEAKTDEQPAEIMINKRFAQKYIQELEDSYPWKDFRTKYPTQCRPRVPDKLLYNGIPLVIR